MQTPAWKVLVSVRSVGTCNDVFFSFQARRSETASAAVHAAFGGHGLGDMPKHKSALEKAKEASKTGAGLPKRAPAWPPINRHAQDHYDVSSLHWDVCQFF